jgi:uncharacterized protein
MYDQKVLKKMDVQMNGLTSNVVENPKIVTIKMLEDSEDKIPIYINFDNLVRYHFGIFAFTGGGKSNLLSNLLRKI